MFSMKKQLAKAILDKLEQTSHLRRYYNSANDLLHRATVDLNRHYVLST